MWIDLGVGGPVVVGRLVPGEDLENTLVGPAQATEFGLRIPRKLARGLPGGDGGLGATRAAQDARKEDVADLFTEPAPQGVIAV